MTRRYTYLRLYLRLPLALPIKILEWVLNSKITDSGSPTADLGIHLDRKKQTDRISINQSHSHISVCSTTITQAYCTVAQNGQH